jgi:NADPH:quinone reductase-like Zn-dependent oxidoreductase
VLTAVTSSKNIDLVEALGADRVIDYTTTDFTDGADRYDRILDTVGNRSVSDLRRVLADGGKVAVTGFSNMRNLLGTSLRGGKDVTQVSAHVATSDLDQLSALIDAGKVRPVIDRTYPFEEIPAAIAYVEEGHAKGKVVADVP